MWDNCVDQISRKSIESKCMQKKLITRDERTKCDVLWQATVLGSFDGNTLNEHGMYLNAKDVRTLLRGIKQIGVTVIHAMRVMHLLVKRYFLLIIIVQYPLLAKAKITSHVELHVFCVTNVHGQYSLKRTTM